MSGDDDPTPGGHAPPTGDPAPSGGPPAWVPNAISGLRVVLVPVFLIAAGECQVAARAGEEMLPTRLMALGVLSVIALSDVVDGWLARRFGLSSTMGAFLDAFADKLCQVTLLLFFAWSEGPAYVSVPVWFFSVIFGRDVVIGLGFLIIRHKRGVVHGEHRWHGKLSSLMVFVLLFWIAADLPPDWATEAFVVVAAAVAANALAYLWDGWKQYRGLGARGA